MRKLLFVALFLGILLSPALFLLLTAEEAPLVAEPRAATPEDALRAKQLALGFRKLTEQESGDRTFRFTEQDLNGAFAFASRAVPSVRARADVKPGGVAVDVSVRLPTGKWMNGMAEFTPAVEGIDLASLQIGQIGLPAGLVIPAAEQLLNMVLGDGLGTIAFNGVRNTRITGKTVTTEVVLTKADRKAIASRTKDTMRTVSGFSTAEDLRGYWLDMHEAATNGTLNPKGTFAQFLHFAVDRAANRATADTARYEMQTALYAIAILCGHPNLQFLIGNVVPQDLMRERSVCADATLAGRRDLRAHFAVSAGLQIASDAGFAFAVGEYKELLDANKGGSGFSFDDIAADRAGIEFAIFLKQSNPVDWPTVIARLRQEQDMFPRIDDLPSTMPQNEFESRFGSVDSPAYRDMLAKIDARISRLPVFSLN